MFEEPGHVGWKKFVTCPCFLNPPPCPKHAWPCSWPCSVLEVCFKIHLSTQYIHGRVHGCVDQIWPVKALTRKRRKRGGIRGKKNRKILRRGESKREKRRYNTRERDC